MLLCRKTSGPCARLAPTYIGITGEGADSSFTHRLGEHLGTATQAAQVDTVKTVGRHFRLPGHNPHRDMIMLPIERVRGDLFLRKAREKFNIRKFNTEKRLGICEVEHGLNLDGGQ